jgi:hypothetical protein
MRLSIFSFQNCLSTDSLVPSRAVAVIYRKSFLVCCEADFMYLSNEKVSERKFNCRRNSVSKGNLSFIYHENKKKERSC